jgi:thioredoxin 1
VEVIESNEEWERLLTEDPAVTIICKFTAEWCKPCKAIQPLFESVSSSHGPTAASEKVSKKFVTVDVDVLDDVASAYNIVTLPTIMAIQNGRVIDKYSGSDHDAIREFVAKVKSSS